ncbi:PadR family transcriptional regulator [Halopiger thermotolerans]
MTRSEPTTLEIKPEQVSLLALLFSSEESKIKGKTRLQKLAFLLDKEEVGEEKDLYKFIKYDYGPFSKQLMEDVDFFKEEGFIEVDTKRTFSGNTRYDYKLTNEGEQLANLLFNNVDDAEELHNSAKEITEQYNEYPIRKLVEYVYDEYPEYKENSVYEY